MKNNVAYFLFALSLSLALVACQRNPINRQSASSIELMLFARYDSGLQDKGAAEVVAFDNISKKVFVTNAATNSVDVLVFDKVGNIELDRIIELKEYGSPNSVAVFNGVVAVAVSNEPKQKNGWVVFFDNQGEFLNKLEVGALPDMLTFSKKGEVLLIANEGEPNQGYGIDPEGSISIVYLSSLTNDGVRKLSQSDVATAGFKAFNKQHRLDSQVRIFGPNATVAQDLEPEYITITDDAKTAWVSLQENNAIARININTATVESIFALGSKSFDIGHSMMDASDKDGMVSLRNWPVYGLYQPDSIASYQYQGRTYIVTANEGDARDYAGYSEEKRVAELKIDELTLLRYPNLMDETQLGRLKVSKVNADLDHDGRVDKLEMFGARSFSIWRDDGEQVYDSGDEFAKITAQNTRLFNNDDQRSDDKGAEPEALAIGQVNGKTYAFIGLERTNGIFVYDISVPSQASFVQYLDTNQTEGDVAPEGMTFVAASISPIGQPLLIVANEVSGTTSIYKIQ